MLEEFIANIFYNRKRYFYSFIGFVVALLLVTIGLDKTIFVVLITILGYYLGSPKLNEKLKKIKNILKEDLREETDDKKKNSKRRTF